MKKLLLITVLCAPFFVSAQKLLKPVINGTGDTVWATSKEKLYVDVGYLSGVSEAMNCTVKRFSKGNIILLILNPLKINSDAILNIYEDSKAYLNLSDNSTVTLTCLADNLGSFKISDDVATVNTAHSSIGIYRLSAEDIRKISAAPIKSLRVETSDGNFDCVIKPKNSGILKKQLDLVINAK